MIRIIILSVMIIPGTLPGQSEICDNGRDDDNDGLIDLNDTDCICQVIEPISLIPNPSFEEMNCCPSDRSQLNCAATWIQASEATTDYIHTCDWLGWDDFPPPRPFPDGQGIMGFRDGRVIGNGGAEPFWKEYAGACLINPLLANMVYRFQFDVGFVDAQKSPPIDISFFGTPECEFLPFGVGNDAFGCPTNSPNWTKLGEVRVTGGPGNKWVNTFLEVTPQQDIYAIAIGPDCDPVESPISIYYFFDNLLLADLESFNLQIAEEHHPCSNDHSLSVPENPNFEYQWYKSGIALVGEKSGRLNQNYGEGSYQVRVLDGSSCRVSPSFEYTIPVFEETERISICEGDSYNFGGLEITEDGVYLDTLKNADNCDRIVTLELITIGAKYDTAEVEILEGETYQVQNYKLSEPGEYPLALSSSIGCDSLVLLRLSNFKVYIPNVFSPNEDGHNDYFYPVSKAGKIISFNISIYDRWGSLVFKGKEWEGQNASPGVFIFIIDIIFDQGVSKIFYGQVTVLK